MTDQRHQGLERSAGFVMGMAYRKLVAILQQRLKVHGITSEQWTVLFQVSKTDGLIQTEIAYRSGKDKPTTTRILEHLEAKGLVTKKAGVQDKRSFSVSITEAGRAMLEKTIPLERGVVEAPNLGLTEDENEQLLGLLAKINRHLDDLADKE